MAYAGCEVNSKYEVVQRQLILVKKILVTGGAGFIGSHLCERLSKDKTCEVYSLDNYSTGVISNHMPDVTYISGETKDISSIIKFKPDCVYHLGEYSRVEQSFDDITKLWNYNKDGTFAVLEFCRSCGAKIIYAGSSTKYGDDGAGKSQSPYAWAKSSNTELVKNYGDWFGVPHAITYFYNVYGDREISDGKYATLIGLFTKKLLQGEKLPVVSPGTQLRNFTYIDDIIDGLILVGERGHGDEYGIGHHDSYTIFDVVKMFGSDFEMLPERLGNRMTAKVITSKTEALGWQAKMSLPDYINSIVQNRSHY